MMVMVVVVVVVVVVMVMAAVLWGLRGVRVTSMLLSVVE
jgi:hypothetical protein